MQSTDRWRNTIGRFDITEGTHRYSLSTPYDHHRPAYDSIGPGAQFILATANYEPIQYANARAFQRTEVAHLDLEPSKRAAGHLTSVQHRFYGQ